MTIKRILTKKLAWVAPLLTVLTLFLAGGATAATTNVTLAWNPNTESGLAGYNVYYGTASRVYPSKLSVSSTTTNATINNLQTGLTYYFAVTATNTAGLESDYSAEVSYTIPVNNTAPIANNQSVTTLEDTAKAVTLTGSDADGNTLTYAVLTQPSKGTLSGTAPNLTYTPGANANGSDSFTFQVNDGTVNSTTATVSISITPVNDAPIANAQSVTTLEDTAKAITLTGSDVDGNSLTFAVVSQPAKGTLSGSVPNLTYTPNANANGSDSFTFRVNDGTVNSGTVTVAISITPVNDTPIANVQSVVTDKNVAKAVVLSGSDADSDTLTFTVVTQPTKGTLSGTAPNLTYTPNNNATGADSFTFRVNDGTVNSTTATVSITINNVNVTPIANAQSVTTLEDTAKAITLAGADADGDTLTYAVLTQPTKGTLSGTAPNVTYTPSADYSGSDSFTFRVSDGTTNSAVATVAITVNAVNDTPIANAQSVTTLEDTAKAIMLTGSDGDGDSLTFAVVSQPTKGTLSGTAPNLTYTPNADATGSDSFTFRANDGTANSATATVAISITPVNDTPIANAQSVTTLEDTATAITLNGSDVDGNTLTYAVVVQPTKGTLSGTAPNLTYTPNANANGSDSFTFRVNDGMVNSSVATVAITVTPVNDAPVANAQNVAALEDTAKTITLTGSDVDGDALTYSVVSQPTKGTLSGTAPNLVYLAATNYFGSDSFTFRVNDGATNSALATVTITIAADNQPPLAIAQSVTTAEDTAKTITLAGSDPDNNPLTYTVVTQPTKGALSGTAPNLTYTPSANANGSDSFTFRVNDGTVNSPTATVSLTVTAVNDAPVAIAQSTTTSEETAKIITLAGSDVDGDSLTFAIVAAPTHGTLSGTAPNVTYTPAADYSGPDSFSFKANDGTVDSSVALVSINVTPVNDAPIASAQSVITVEDTAKAITLAGTDADGNTLVYAIVTQPAHGTLTGTAPNVTYRPSTNYSGADSFSFKVNDGTVDSASALISITVTPVNDAPIAAAQTIGTDRNVAAAITLTGSDVDGDTVTFAVLTQPTKGVLSGTAPNLTYTPNNNATGADSFTFRVSDGTLNSASATVAINIAQGPNTVPVAGVQSVTTAEDTAKAITLTGTDADDNTLSFVIVTPPTKGTLSGTGATRTYTPAANYNGSDSFTFKVNDGTVDSAPATVSITVSPVNDAPIANAQSVTTLEDTAKAITLAGSDLDDDTLTYTVVTQPTKGSLSGTAPNVTYLPATNYFGADSFTFRVNDGTTNSATATVSITVTPGNDAPVAIAQNVATDEDTAKAITLSATDTDGDALTYTVTTPPANGTLSGTGANRTYTPVKDFNGADSFWFKASDGTADSALVAVSITVNAVNDAPVANAIALATDKNTAKAIVLTGSDVDSDNLTFAVVTQPTKGVLSGTAPNLTYTPSNNVTGADSFTFRANDGTTNSATATVAITIAPGPNTAPTAIAQAISTAEDTATAITLTGSDVDDDTLSFTVVTPPTRGTLSGIAPNLTYTPTANFNGSDTVWFKVNDGTVDSSLAVVSITVTDVNDAPVANAQNVAAVAGTAKPIVLTGSDVDGDTLTFAVVGQPTKGTLTGAAPNLTYTPDSSATGSDSFTFRANDGATNSAMATVAITLSPAPNVAPIASAQSVTTAEDTAKAITLAGTDADNNTLTYSVVTQPTKGTLSGTPPNVSYLPGTNYFGADSFTFRVHDGTDYSPAATVSLTVTPVNDAPTLSPIADVVVSENSGSKLVALSGISAGPNESQTLTVTASSSNPGLIAPTVTYASASASGSLAFTPTASTTGSAIITVTVNDGQAANHTATQSFTVTVEAVTSPITLDPIADMTVDESAPQQVITLSGIGIMAEATATSSGTLTSWLQNNVSRIKKHQALKLTVTAASSDTRIIPTPTVSYTSPSDKGTLMFAPAPGAAGTATISVTATDDQNPPVTRSFKVTVKDINEAPTLDAIASLTLSKNAGKQTVALTGMSAGAGETQSFTVTATSSNPGLIPNPQVIHSGTSTAGTLTFNPVADATGSAVITVKVDDGQAENNVTTRTFMVTVSSETLDPTIALTSPGAGSSHSAPATITLAAAVTANGHSISKVQFFAGATLIGEDASAPYTADWDCETAGTYRLVARAHYEASGTVDSPAVSITVKDSNLPAPWATIDIGSVSVPGSVTVEQDNFTVQGAGVLEGTDDSLRFVYQPLTDDGEIWVNIADLPTTGSAATSGIMIRESLSSASRYVFIGKLPDGNLQMLTRDSNGGQTITKQISNGKPADWVRIVRKGDLFVLGYAKKPGSWSIGSLENITMAANIHVGLAVTSGDMATLNTATFKAPVVVP